jgi:hypothetical protein
MTTVLDVLVVDSFDLDYSVTSSEYGYNYKTTGDLRVTYPWGFLDDLYKNLITQPEPIVPLFGGIVKNHVGVILGLAASPPLKEEFLENLYSEAISVEGIPDNGAVKLERVLALSELKELVEGKYELPLSHKYAIKGLPTQLLPIVVEARLIKDASDSSWFKFDDEYASKRWEGLSAIVITPKRGEYVRKMAPKFVIDHFSIKFKNTFPTIVPRHPIGGRYDPINKTMTWDNIEVSDEVAFEIVGPFRDLVGTERLECEIKATLGVPISGVHVDKVFDLNGISHKGELTVNHKTRAWVKINLEPSALTTAETKTVESTMSFSVTPFIAHKALLDCFVSLGAPPLSYDLPSALRSKMHDPVTHKRETYKLTTNIETKKEYEEGMVYLEATLNGEFTSVRVAHDLTDEIRETMEEAGGIEDKGSTDIHLKARSTSRELALDFLREIESVIHTYLR